jgi:large subunit ribosomal protein L29
MSVKKTNELRDKSVNELQTRERELSEQMFKLRFQRATGSLENPSKMRQVRREIARIKTLLKEKSNQDASAR